VKPLAEELARRRAAGLYRTRLTLDSPQGVEVVVDGEPLLAFCSNDYLGLANDPRVVAAFARGAERYGAGAGASHLVSGHLAPHALLERELAAFVGAERALLFSTGYMANLGLVSALTERHGRIYEDRLNHASLIDAARLAGARVRRYRHGDAGQLAELLAADRPPGGMIVTDAVFSMDGDLAPLADLQTLAGERGLFLLADDAHGLGVLGPGGRGTFEHLGLARARHSLLMGTLGKAFGVFGAFVAGPEEVIDTLVQRARTYIYTTALPPALAEALRESLRVIQGEPERRARLIARIAQFRAGARELGLSLPSSGTPIQPLVLGTAEAALAAAASLRAQGLLVPAIRPPTVPEGTARLRITLSSAHTGQQVERLLAALATLPRP
jgi:8-amino-7-oxononanoate synthase